MKTFIQHIALFLFILLLSNKAKSQCTDNGNVWNESWKSCSETMSPNTVRGQSHWLLFEFNQPESIESIYVWNANRSGESQLGAKNIIIDYSVDGNTWEELGQYVFPQATEANNYDGFEGPELPGIFIEKLLITVLDNYDTNNNCVSIAEFELKINPDACYGQIDICGVCDGQGASVWYQDTDNDGMGNGDAALYSCSQPAGYVDNADDQCDTGLVGWDDVAYIFYENGCTGCHGSNAIAGLNLLSYESTIAGGNNCGSDLITGTRFVDIIEIDGYDGCSGTIGIPSMNSRVGNQVDADELATIQKWINDGAIRDCNCPPNAPDSDNDGVCDNSDDCPNFDNALIGSACDDGNDCTDNDVYLADCQCVGTPKFDTDNDGICDLEDVEPNNPCTADGIVDGNEPPGWKDINTADCDGDGISSNSGDLDDFNPCMNHLGYSQKSDCICPNDMQTGGAELYSFEGFSTPENATGLPDGLTTGYIGGNDRLVLRVPSMAIGEEVCFYVGFSDPNGIAGFDISGYFFSFTNPTEDNTYAIQQVCLPIYADGEQLITVSEFGPGGIRMDGISYNYCDCAPSDSEYDKLKCSCSNIDSNTTTNVSFSAGISNPENASGLPDGIYTGGIGGSTDSLEFQFANANINDEICLDFKFNNAAGKFKLTINQELSYLVNPYPNDLDIPITYCWTVTQDGPQDVLLQDNGSGQTYVDGIWLQTCTDCQTNAVDSDNDGVCDEIDLCDGGNDNIDFDYDGIPDQCENCDTPQDAFAINVTSNSATILFEQVNEYQYYEVAYKKADAEYWNVVSTTDNFLNVNNLEGCTLYHFAVRSNCGFGFTSPLSELEVFNTLEDANCSLCAEPENLDVSSVQESSALVTWDESSIALEYQVEYRNVTTGSGWNTVNTAFNFLILSNLDACSIIEINVYNRCLDGSLSIAAQRTFTTLGCPIPCDPLQGLYTNNITNSSVILVWDLYAQADYNLYYRKQGNQWNLFNTSFPLSILFTLESCTSYEWYIEVDCGDNTFSAPSSVQSFTTTGCNPAQADDDQKLETESIQLASDEGLLLYPVPTDNTLFIEYESTSDFDTQVILYNMQGQSYGTYDFDTSEGMNTHSIQTNDLLTGTYFIHLKNKVMSTYATFEKN